MLMLRDAELDWRFINFSLLLTDLEFSVTLINNDNLSQTDPKPYAFFVNKKEIVNNLESVVEGNVSTEKTISIIYQPQAIFRVSQKLTIALLLGYQSFKTLVTQT